MSPTETAGYLSQYALSEAGIPSRRDAGTSFIAVAVDAETDILICNPDSAIDHDPAHDGGGWVVLHHYDVENGLFTAVYQTGIRDFATDTAAVVNAIQRYLADPAPWSQKEYDAACGPYITAGEHLRRALTAAGTNALNIGSTSPAAFVTVRVQPLGPGTVLIADRHHAVDHPAEAHTGWTALYTPHWGDFTSPGARLIYTSDRTDFTGDTTAVTDAVRTFLTTEFPSTAETTNSNEATDDHDPEPGTEYPYAISDYARETARVLGVEDGWRADSGYLGAYGLIWGPGVATLQLIVEDDQFHDLVLREHDTAHPDTHVVDLPDSAPRTPAELRAVARRIADLIRTHYPA